MNLKSYPNKSRLCLQKTSAMSLQERRKRFERWRWNKEKHSILRKKGKKKDVEKRYISIR